MHKIFLRTLLYIIGITLLASCTEEKVYKIGVAQCSKGPWREKVNREMLAAQHLYEHDVKGWWLLPMRIYRLSMMP